MQLFRGSLRFVQRQATASSTCAHFNSTRTNIRSTGIGFSSPDSNASAPASLFESIPKFVNKIGDRKEAMARFSDGMRRVSMLYGNAWPCLSQLGTMVSSFPSRCMTTEAESVGSTAMPDIAPRIKFKRLDKTAKHIMQILDKEAVEEVREKREIPDIKPGYIVQLKVEAPENKRRVSVVKGIVIARRNAGLNTTFRIRRLVAGVGVESLFPLYSPSIKEITVLDKKKVRRAKLYYLRDKMNALKKH